MKKPLLLALLAVLLSVPSFGQISVKRVAQLNTEACAAGGLDYKLFVASDATDGSDCSVGGGDGTTPALCWCYGGSFVSLSTAVSPDLSGYALLAGADFTGPITATLTETGDEISFRDGDFTNYLSFTTDASGTHGQASFEASVTDPTTGGRVVMEMMAANGESSVTQTGDGGAGMVAWRGYDGEASAKLQADQTGGTYTQPMYISVTTDGNNPRAEIGSGDLGLIKVSPAKIEAYSYLGPVSIQGCSDYGPRLNYSTITLPVECDRFFDTTLHVPCFYNGSAWKSAIDGTTDCTSGS